MSLTLDKPVELEPAELESTELEPTGTELTEAELAAEDAGAPDDPNLPGRTTSPVNGHRNSHSHFNADGRKKPKNRLAKMPDAVKEKTTKASTAKTATVKNGHRKPANQPDIAWNIQLLPVGEIGPNPFQPREEFDEEEMEELAASVAEHGVQTPVIVRTVPTTEPHAQNGDGSATVTPAAPLFRYELVVGERRQRACLRAGRKLIPTIVRDDLSDSQAAELALIENVQRSNLNVIEEARGYKRLMLRFRFTEVRIAKKVGKSIATIQAAIKLLELPEEVQTMLLKKQLSVSHGHELLKLASHPQICVSVALKVQAEKLTAASLGDTLLPNARELKRRGRVAELDYRTKFDWKNECKACPFKAFVTSGYTSYCLQPEEWQKKQSHALEMEKQESARVLEEARRQGESQVDLHNLPTGSYRNLQWGEPPAGCSAQCLCRGEAADPRDGTKRIPVCLDPARLDSLRKEEREAMEAERERRYQSLWEGAVSRIAAEPIQSVSPATEMVATSTVATEPVRAVEQNRDLNGTELLVSQDFEASDLEFQGSLKNLPGEGDAESADVDLNRSEESTLRGMLAWNKVAPLLVLPILRGEDMPYSTRQNWEETVRDTASRLDLELPWDQLMESEDEGDLLRLLEPLPADRLLFLGAALLLRQEAGEASHWQRETPLLEFVLDLQKARQTALKTGEITQGEPAETEGAETETIEAEVVEDGEPANAEHEESDEVVENGEEMTADLPMTDDLCPTTAAESHDAEPVATITGDDARDEWATVANYLERQIANNWSDPEEEGCN